MFSYYSACQSSDNQNNFSLPEMDTDEIANKHG